MNEILTSDVTSAIVDFSPLLEQLIYLAGSALLAVGTWAAKRFSDKIGLENDSKIREYLLTAVENGVEFGAKKAQEQVNDRDWTKIDVKNVMVAHATGYVLTKVPDAVKRFKLTEEDITDLIESKLK